MRSIRKHRPAWQASRLAWLVSMNEIAILQDPEFPKVVSGVNWWEN